MALDGVDTSLVPALKLKSEELSLFDAEARVLVRRQTNEPALARGTPLSKRAAAAVGDANATLAARAPAQQKRNKGAKRVLAPSGADPSAEPQMRTSSNTLDTRGMYLEDAELELERYLDRCLVDGRKRVFVLHGHGTGALKKGLRSFLQRQPAVLKFKSATEADGGDAFTVIDLR